GPEFFQARINPEPRPLLYLIACGFILLSKPAPWVLCCLNLWTRTSRSSRSSCCTTHGSSAIKKKKPVLFAPVVPLSFVLAYQMDMGYGTLIYRMRGEAESIMVSEHDRLDLPHGVPNFESIEKARRAKTALGSLFEK
uniref:Plasminogen receptor, C-terminal lysine transmembrane protein n=1 Tax=Oncorhynchus kisutch TaxID=8019 RepID=A0A8C7JWP9_ONCKI